MEGQSHHNGQPPGYQAPIFNAMQEDQLVAYVPRPILCIIVLICVGIGVLSRSWGALPLYVLLHSLAAYKTSKDPRWLPVLAESLRFRYRVYRLRFHEAAWRVHVRWLWAGTAVGILLLYVVTLWLL